MSDCVENEGYSLDDYLDKLADIHNYVLEMVRKFKGLRSLKHASSLYNAEDLLNDPVAINLIQLENLELKIKLKKVELNQNNVKPLSPIERGTLLIIIAALAKEPKVDITKTSKAGELIENMTQRMRARISATTAETPFKKISQALTNRPK